MPIELTPHEARVIGCLIEKQIATPDQYPLSVNALANACNQKSNREPVLDLDDRTVQATLDALARRQLVLEKSGRQGTAIVCELLLRGPQTPGELRSHAARLAPFGDVSEVEAELEELMTRPDGPFVAKLPREPGRRESRYMQLFGGDPPPMAEMSNAVPVPAPAPADPDRVAALEAAVAELRREVDALKERLDR